jgi:hypothetical protein
MNSPLETYLGELPCILEASRFYRHIQGAQKLQDEEEKNFNFHFVDKLSMQLYQPRFSLSFMEKLFLELSSLQAGELKKLIDPPPPINFSLRSEQPFQIQSLI